MALGRWPQWFVGFRHAIGLRREQRIAQVAEEVPTVGNLDSLGCALRGSLDVVVGTVAGNDLDLGTSLKPLAQSLGRSLRRKPVTVVPVVGSEVNFSESN